MQKIHHLAKLTNVCVIDISEIKLDSSILSNEFATEGYELIRIDPSKKKKMELLVSSSTLLLIAIKVICVLTCKVFSQKYIYVN